MAFNNSCAWFEKKIETLSISIGLLKILTKNKIDSVTPFRVGGLQFVTFAKPKMTPNTWDFFNIEIIWNYICINLLSTSINWSCDYILKTPNLYEFYFAYRLAAKREIQMIHITADYTYVKRGFLYKITNLQQTLRRRFLI